ncbi:MAG: o-succinylbenzoate synthase [Muribaculaceae bacterium]|nr:o-succinylbenzoate synthase [Muribaculaceae bacterium]
MLKAQYCRYDLHFNFVAITSRQSMTVKETYFIKVFDTDSPDVYGVGECAVFRGLGADDTPDYEDRLKNICRNINSIDIDDVKESSLRFGLETAIRDLATGGQFRIFDSDVWLSGETAIPINGLVWMGDFDTMKSRLDQKVGDGFKCIKIKIGGIDFERELDLIRYIRDCYSASNLQIRLDANGSMSPSDALHRLERLARYDIHSIEQPIRQGQWKQMREITRCSPIPIALDEELIGTMNYDQRCYLLDATMPQYIILKPSLHGSFSTCDGWIKDAADREIKWWATSALESNIGLNAIAQWAVSKNVNVPQGLGTGGLYTNNIPSPLVVRDAALAYDNSREWNIGQLTFT